MNLYPFQAMIDAGADFDQCIENIDVGGPAMIRAAVSRMALRRSSLLILVMTDLTDDRSVSQERLDVVSRREIGASWASVCIAACGSGDVGAFGW